MSKAEVIRALADYFDLEVPKNVEDIHNDYDWTSGCSMGSIDTPWLTLENVVIALDRAWLLDDDDEDYDDDDDE